MDKGEEADLAARYERNRVTSPLLRLPREIRDKIYTFFLGNKILHLTGDYDQEQQVPPFVHRVLANVCPSKIDDIEFSTTYYHKALNTYNGPRRFGSNLLAGHLDCLSRWPPGPWMVNMAGQYFNVWLLQSCRQVHQEAYLVLLQTNTFNFLDPSALISVIGSKAVPWSHFQHIRSLSLGLQIGNNEGPCIPPAYIGLLTGVRHLSMTIELSF
ncbi:hypothetical protein K431DRAFT_334463 [Polychaeton citri CBS 116435]|uniref:DUF7730 domain-containing protein n=1 Tax=Polychaeton citri CBS 116435 TaxID=1314669 RepID=A0A9P4Q2K3_9PEZI|nr:hypothetical protein K431DRAFT_334463 [Polychaeton citri CBS 116435]